MRKFITSLLVLVMMFLIFPSMSSNSFAEDTVVDINCLDINERGEISGFKDGTSEDAKKGKLDIPDTLDGTKVIGIGMYAFFKCSGLTSITIPNSVTYIDMYAFGLCSGLTSITIPNSVKTIGNYVFHKCSALKSISIPNSVETIGSGAFANCSNLTSVSIPNKVTSIAGGTFRECTNLTSVSIPNSVKIIDKYAFYQCTNLNSAIYIGTKNEFNNINISDGNDYLKNKLNYIFNIDDGVLTTTTQSTLLSGDFVIPDTLDKIKVTGIGNNAFSGCNNLTSVSIPDSVTSIGTYAFKDCSGLTSVSIPNRVTSIGNGAFGMCSNLKSVSIPNSVETIDDMAFACCPSLKSVTIPGSVKTIGGRAFSDCQNFIYLGTEDNWKKIKGYDNVSSLDNIYFKDEESHIWTRWYTFRKATDDKEGLECHFCTHCQKFETRAISK